MEHNLLPQEVQDILKTAASVDPLTPMGESGMRRQAVDHAVDGIKNRYPDFFVKE